MPLLLQAGRAAPWLLLLAVVATAARSFAQEAPSPGPAPGYALTGRMTDEAGNPIADVRLTFSSIQGQRLTLRAITNQNGEFFLDGDAAEGAYRVAVTSAEWVAEEDGPGMRTVTLKRGATAEFHLKLRRSVGTLIRVVNEAGQPVEAALVSLNSPAGRGARGGAGRGPFRTNEAGLAAVQGIPSSDQSRKFWIAHPDYAPSEISLTLNRPGETELHQVILAKGKDVTCKVICTDGLPAVGWEMLVAVARGGNSLPSGEGIPIGEDGSFTVKSVKAGTLYQVVMHIVPPPGEVGGLYYTLHESVDLATLDGTTIRAPTLSPLSMATVTGKIEYIGEPPTNQFRIDADSLDHSSYASAHILKRGQTEFTVGPLAKVATRLRIHGQDAEGEDVIVTPPGENVVIRVRRPTPPKILGQVVDDETGAPVPDFRVVMVKRRSLSASDYIEPGYWRPFSDAGGKFEMALVGPGIYQALVLATGYAPQWSGEVNSQEGQLTTIRLTRGFPVRGQVRNAQGTPVAGARVIVEVREAYRESFQEPLELVSAVTDESGAFEIPHLNAARHPVRIVHPDYPVASRTFEISATSAPLEIALNQWGAIRGTVFTADGRPAAGISLEVMSPSDYARGQSRNALSVVSDEYGGFRFPRLAAGQYILARGGNSPAKGVIRQTVLVEEGRDHRVDLGGFTLVTGRVLLNGQPLAVARVQAVSDAAQASTRFLAEVETDSEGRFQIYGIPPGHWHFQFALPGGGGVFGGLGDFDVTGDVLDLGDVAVETGVVRVRLDPPTVQLEPRGEPITILPVVRMSLARSLGVTLPRTAPDAPYIVEHVLLGQHRVSARLSAGTGVTREIELTADRREIDITLRVPSGTSTISGIVDAAVLSQWTSRVLRLMHDETGFAATVRVGDDGRFAASGLPAGNYSVRITPLPDSTLLTLTLGEGESREITLGADVAARIESGRPRGFLQVLTSTPEGIPFPAHVELTDAAGKVLPLYYESGAAVSRYPAGKYTLTVKFPGFETVTREVRVPPATTDGRVPPGGSVQITLVPR